MAEERGQTCPACGKPVELPPSPRIARCRQCGHRWLPTTADEQALAEKSIYTREYAGYRDDPVLAGKFEVLIARELAPRLLRGARVLDVGCGGGAFLDAASRAGYVVQGLDVSEDAAQLCRERGHDASSGDFLAGDDFEPVDAVTMWDVLEHLRAPADFLDTAARRLRPGGLLVAKVPVYGALSVSASDWLPRIRPAILGAPDHVQYYTPGSLAALVHGSPLELVSLVELATGIRTPPTGGGPRKRIARFVKSMIAALSGEGNILLVAQRA